MIIAFVSGALSWSLCEYSLHRFLGHGPRAAKHAERRSLFDGDFGSEHQAHHTDTRYFSPTARKLQLGLVVLPVLGTACSLLVGPVRGISFTLGFGAAYAGYEILHRRTHTHRPRGFYSRWARKNHLHHHFADPKQNHGVTSPLWDFVFRTHVAPGRIRVPIRHAPAWLIDESGELEPEYASDYQLQKKPANRSASDAVP